jgi:hypothetical protein
VTPPPTIRGGQPATFTSQASDNLGLVSSLAVVNYATTTELNLRYDGSAIGSQFAAPFTRTSGLSATIPAFIRAISLQAGVTNSATSTFGSGAFTNINAIALGATDIGGNPGYGTLAAAGIAALLDPTQTAPTFFGGSGLQNVSLLFTPNTTTTASAAAPLTLRSATTGQPSAVTLTFRQSGLANTPFVSPFTRIQLYQRSNLPNTVGIPGSTTTTAYRLIGDFAAGGLSVTPAASTINSTFTVTPGSNGITGFTSSAGTTQTDLLVVASDANGYAVAFIVPTITLTNP